MTCSECRDGGVIRDGLASMNVEAHVTTEPPIVKNEWTKWFACPACGRTWYAEPTPEQRMTWTKDKTP